MSVTCIYLLNSISEAYLTYKNKFLLNGPLLDCHHYLQYAHHAYAGKNPISRGCIYLPKPNADNQPGSIKEFICRVALSPPRISIADQPF